MDWMRMRTVHCLLCRCEDVKTTFPDCGARHWHNCRPTESLLSSNNAAPAPVALRYDRYYVTLHNTDTGTRRAVIINLVKYNYIGNMTLIVFRNC